MLRRRSILTEFETRFFILQLLGALKYMHHAKRVIHRDLKLGNIFLDEHMNVKIGDFGLAALLVDENDRKTTMCGTPNYIAPEVLFGSTKRGGNGSGHSFEVDLWSMGVILYALLIGRPPFQAQNIESIYEKIRESQFTFPASSAISAPARALITSLLHKDPASRPSLDATADHPFFRHGWFPRRIPTSATTKEPVFKTSAGVLVSGAGLSSNSAWSESRRNYFEVAKAAGIGLDQDGNLFPCVGDKDDEEIPGPVAPIVKPVTVKQQNLSGAVTATLESLSKPPLRGSEVAVVASSVVEKTRKAGTKEERDAAAARTVAAVIEEQAKQQQLRKNKAPTDFLLPESLSPRDGRARMRGTALLRSAALGSTGVTGLERGPKRPSVLGPGRARKAQVIQLNGGDSDDNDKGVQPVENPPVQAPMPAARRPRRVVGVALGTRAAIAEAQTIKPTLSDIYSTNEGGGDVKDVAASKRSGKSMAGIVVAGQTKENEREQRQRQRRREKEEHERAHKKEEEQREMERLRVELERLEREKVEKQLQREREHELERERQQLEQDRLQREERRKERERERQRQKERAAILKAQQLQAEPIPLPSSRNSRAAPTSSVAEPTRDNSQPRRRAPSRSASSASLTRPPTATGTNASHISSTSASSSSSSSSSVGSEPVPTTPNLSTSIGAPILHSTTSQILDSLQPYITALTFALTAGPSLRSVARSETDSAATKEAILCWRAGKGNRAVFITKWVDYTNKYGIGYSMTDGSIGVMFNDNTGIICADGLNQPSTSAEMEKEGETWYISQGYAPTSSASAATTRKTSSGAVGPLETIYRKHITRMSILLKERSTASNNRRYGLPLPPDSNLTRMGGRLAEAKVAMWRRFGMYMRDSLRGGQEHDFLRTEEDLHPVGLGPRSAGRELIFISTYARLKQGAFFRFSNGEIQFNFCDHSKLVLSDKGQTIRFLTKARNLIIMGADEVRAAVAVCGAGGGGGVAGSAGAGELRKEEVDELVREDLKSKIAFLRGFLRAWWREGRIPGVRRTVGCDTGADGGVAGEAGGGGSGEGDDGDDGDDGDGEGLEGGGGEEEGRGRGSAGGSRRGRSSARGRNRAGGGAGEREKVKEEVVVLGEV